MVDISSELIAALGAHIEVAAELRAVLDHADAHAEALRAAGLVWTKELPTEAGWYWHRSPDCEPHVVQVRTPMFPVLTGDALVVWDGLLSRWGPALRLGGEWSSAPIPAPAERAEVR